MIAIDLNIGHSKNDPSVANVGRINPIGGWKQFVNGQIKEYYDEGARLIFLHNPFGAQRNEAMQFDQVIHAEGLKLWWLTRGYERAWRGWKQKYPGLKIVDYLGKLRDDKEFQAHLMTGRPDKYLHRLWRSVRKSLAVSHEICFDAMGNADPIKDNVEIETVRFIHTLLDNSFDTAFVEATVPYTNSKLLALPQWVTWGAYRRRHLTGLMHPKEVGKYPSWTQHGNPRHLSGLGQGQYYVAIFRPEDFDIHRFQTIRRNGHIPVVRTMDQFKTAKDWLFQEAENMTS